MQIKGEADQSGGDTTSWREGVARVGCRNWRINVRSRQKWRKVTEEVKSHPGTYSQWKKKKTT
jgi:hypothetical protein